MYERILVAVDADEISQLALAHAVRLAAALKATVGVVHGVDAVSANVYKNSDRDRFLTPRLQAGQEILSQAAAVVREAGVNCEERLLEIDKAGRDRLPEAIVQQAADWGASLILVGTHGRRGVSHVLLGSVAEGLVHISPKPVLVIPGKTVAGATGEPQTPPRGSPVPYVNVMVAVDGTETSELPLREAIGFAKVTGAALRLVYVAGTAPSRAADALGAAQAQAREAGVQAEARALEATGQPGAIADAVVAEAAAWPAHLIVAGTHGRRGLDRLRAGSVAEAILRSATAPVLLVHGVADRASD